MASLRGTSILHKFYIKLPSYCESRYFSTCLTAVRPTCVSLAKHNTIPWTCAKAFKLGKFIHQSAILYCCVKFVYWMYIIFQMGLGLLFSYQSTPVNQRCNFTLDMLLHTGTFKQFFASLLQLILWCKLHNLLGISMLKFK